MTSHKPHDSDAFLRDAQQAMEVVQHLLGDAEDKIWQRLSNQSNTIARQEARINELNARLDALELAIDDLLSASSPLPESPALSRDEVELFRWAQSLLCKIWINKNI